MATFEEVQAKAVKDVPAEEFIKAYAAHLKSTDKVGVVFVLGGGSLCFLCVGGGACLTPLHPSFMTFSCV